MSLVKAQNGNINFKIVSGLPATGARDGQTILNSLDNTSYIWYNSTWNPWFTAVPGAVPVKNIYNTDGDQIFNTDGDAITYP